jgi:hypothetical protein
MGFGSEVSIHITHPLYIRFLTRQSRSRLPMINKYSKGPPSAHARFLASISPFTVIYSQRSLDIKPSISHIIT